jgi:hypothetical protein
MAGGPMKRTIAIALILSLAGCLGHSSVDNELEGQVKKVQHVTPIIMWNYDQVDVSLGVMRNGTGSISKEDMWLCVPNQDDVALLKEAAESGTPVKIKYDVARVNWYQEEETVTHVEFLQ